MRKLFPLLWTWLAISLSFWGDSAIAQTSVVPTQVHCANRLIVLNGEWVWRIVCDNTKDWPE